LADATISATWWVLGWYPMRKVVILTGAFSTVEAFPLFSGVEMQPSDIMTTAARIAKNAKFFKYDHLC
jgi:hypothetical protein